MHGQSNSLLHLTCIIVEFDHPINLFHTRRQKTSKPAMIKLKTTEELEMECIAKLRKQTKHHIKVNENLMKKAISCPAVNAVRAGASLTRPQEFHFQTDRRVKQHPMATRSEQTVETNGDDSEKAFWNGLRQHPPSPVMKQGWVYWVCGGQPFGLVNLNNALFHFQNFKQPCILVSLGTPPHPSLNKWICIKNAPSYFCDLHCSAVKILHPADNFGVF